MDFWFKYSDLNKKYEDGPRKRWSYTIVLKALKQQRHNADVEDAAQARVRYNSASTFAEHFSYRTEGNRQIPLMSTASIARQFRKINNRPQYWDLIAEEEQEESEEIDQL